MQQDIPSVLPFCDPVDEPCQTDMAAEPVTILLDDRSRPSSASSIGGCYDPYNGKMGLAEIYSEMSDCLHNCQALLIGNYIFGLGRLELLGVIGHRPVHLIFSH